jgi:GTP diphosphokinase / guanosine-3',5'-bis(diphosphate) 3'-diphosphatase
MSDDLALIFKALDFAAKKHREQRRKDVNATPYINHPIDLARLLTNEAQIVDPNVIVAAILHDTVEDTETTLAELQDEFGLDIAEIVAEVTDDKSLSSQERKQGQIDRAAESSDKAKLIKLADKICNLRDLEKHTPVDWSLQRRREYFDWAKSVIDRIRGVNNKLEQLFDQQYAKRP